MRQEHLDSYLDLGSRECEGKEERAKVEMSLKSHLRLCSSAFSNARRLANPKVSNRSRIQKIDSTMGS